MLLPITKHDVLNRCFRNLYDTTLILTNIKIALVLYFSVTVFAEVFLINKDRFIYSFNMKKTIENFAWSVHSIKATNSGENIKFRYAKMIQKCSFSFPKNWNLKNGQYISIFNE